MNGKCIFINTIQISFKSLVSVIGFLQNSYVILKMKLWAVRDCTKDIPLHCCFATYIVMNV